MKSLFARWMEPRPLMRELAQSAVELTIFGSILIFVIASIARTGLSGSHGMNTQLRAMRMAMTESYRTSMGQYARGVSPAGIASRRTASIYLVEDRLSVAPGARLGSRDRFPMMATAAATFTQNLMYPVDWSEVKAQLPILDLIVNGLRFPLTTAGVKEVHFDETNLPHCADPWPWTHPVTGEAAVGGPCWDAVRERVIFFKRTYNYYLNEDWCSRDPCPDSDFPAAERFDLDFDGPGDGDGDGIGDPPLAEWHDFAWQWLGVTNINLEDNINTTVDVDGDFKEERVQFVAESLGRITAVGVIDFQEGDVDLSSEIDPRNPKVGFFGDPYMFSQTDDGTYLRIEEGKLYDPSNGEYVRDTTRHDHVDTIQRMFRLSNDTHRFCDAGGNPQPNVSGLPNPVEVCNDCFEQANISKTCMDQARKVLYIRSAIRDLRGRRWVTRVTPQ